MSIPRGHKFLGVPPYLISNSLQLFFYSTTKPKLERCLDMRYEDSELHNMLAVGLNNRFTLQTMGHDLNCLESSYIIILFCMISLCLCCELILCNGRVLGNLAKIFNLKPRHMHKST